MIKLSIITVNLNNVSGLQKTIESVMQQTFTDYEFIIIDGGSTDESVDAIKKHQDKITRWVSEPDKGIYNAMNKGIKMAKGEYCLFLNSGDWLVNQNVLQQFLSNTNNEDYVYGNVDTDRGLRRYNEKLTFFTFFKSTLIHQAVFIKTALFEKYGLYNEALTIVADWEFFLKTIINHGCTYKYIDKTICHFELTGVSSVQREKLLVQKEEVLKAMYPMMYDDYLTFQKMQREYNFYSNSRLVQLAKKLQLSKVYRKIRGNN